MKSFTCREMGGPCDFKLTGATADEIMQKGGAHVMEISSQGDEEHKKVLDMMNGMMGTPEGDKWNQDFAAKFAAKPEDQ